MKRYLILILALFVTLPVHADKGRLTPALKIPKPLTIIKPIKIELVSSKTVYKNAEKLNIDIKFFNQMTSSFRLIRPSTGSEIKVRYPYYYFEVVNEKGELLDLGGSMYKAVAPLTNNSFIELGPEKSVSLTDLCLEEYMCNRVFNLLHYPLTPGRYRITFHYSTEAREERQWAGYSSEHKKEIEEKLAMIPREEYKSNQIEILILAEISMLTVRTEPLPDDLVSTTVPETRTW